MAISVVMIAVVVTVLLAVGLMAVGMMRRQGTRLPVDVVVDRDAMMDAEIQDALANGQKIAAIKRYRALTGAGLKEAKDAVEAAADGRAVVGKTGRQIALADAGGVRDLLADGRRDEAVTLYQRFAGVDQYTAQDAVADIERQMRLADGPQGLTLLERSELKQLVLAGRKIEAVKRYRELTGQDLLEAKTAIDEIQASL